MRKINTHIFKNKSGHTTQRKLTDFCSLTPFLLISNICISSSFRYACGGGCSVAKSCPTLCNPMDCSTPALPVHHQLPKFTQTHVH